MLKFSKKVEYALIAIFEMADNSSNEPVTAKSIARQFHIPQELLGKVLQTLAKKGILDSIQGVKGGYTLGHSLDTIKILNVVEAIDGPIALIACNSGNFCDCEQMIKCNIKTPMEMIQYELIRFFNEISLQELKTRHWGTMNFLENKTETIETTNKGFN